MAKFKDLTGCKFGRLRVAKLLRRSGLQPNGKMANSLWECTCVCGKTTHVQTGHLTSGTVLSCGCRRIEAQTKHSLHDHPLYPVWLGIKHRCFDEKHIHYESYGARGITLHEPWLNVVEFINGVESEIGARPSTAHTIDRIRNEGDYRPGNIRWSTASEQANNRRNTKYIELNGVVRPLMDWCKELNLYPSTVRQRIDRRWSAERALFLATKFDFWGNPL